MFGVNYEQSARAAEAGRSGRERRRGADRRRLSWSTFVRGALSPRRRGNRRGHESQSLVDWHEPHLLILSIAILLLSVTDAFLTLTLMTYGAEEANPMLAYLLREFPRAFAGAKMAMTGVGVVILVALARARVFRVIRVSMIMHWCLLGYLGLIVYEWWLLQGAV